MKLANDYLNSGFSSTFYSIFNPVTSRQKRTELKQGLDPGPQLNALVHVIIKKNGVDGITKLW